MPGSWPEDDGAMNIDGESDVCDIEVVAEPSMMNVEPSKSLVCGVAYPP